MGGGGVEGYQQLGTTFESYAQDTLDDRDTFRVN